MLFVIYVYIGKCSLKLFDKLSVLQFGLQAISVIVSWVCFGYISLLVPFRGTSGQLVSCFSFIKIIYLCYFRQIAKTFSTVIIVNSLQVCLFFR